jgi:hypothetical protein
MDQLAGRQGVIVCEKFVRTLTLCSLGPEAAAKTCDIVSRIL